MYQQHFDTFTPGVSKYHINIYMLNLLPILFDGRGSAKFLGHLHPNHSATWPLGGLSWASGDVLGFPQLVPRTVRYMVLQCITIVPGWLGADWALNGQGVSRIGNTMAVISTSGTSGASQMPLQPGGFYTLQNIGRKMQKTCRMVLHTDYVPSTTKPEVQAGCINNCIIQ